MSDAQELLGKIAALAAVNAEIVAKIQKLASTDRLIVDARILSFRLDGAQLLIDEQQSTTPVPSRLRSTCSTRSSSHLTSSLRTRR